MYAKSIRPSAKREVQEERSVKRAMRMCQRSGQIFKNTMGRKGKNTFNKVPWSTVDGFVWNPMVKRGIL